LNSNSFFSSICYSICNSHSAAFILHTAQPHCPGEHLGQILVTATDRTWWLPVHDLMLPFDGGTCWFNKLNFNANSNFTNDIQILGKKRIYHPWYQ